MTTPVVSYPIAIPDVPTIWRGDPFVWQLTLQQANGSAQDLTPFGTTWAASLRTSIDAQTSVDFAVDVSALTSGIVKLSLTAVQTASMHRGKAAYGFDVQASGGSISPFTVWRGSVNVDGEYTHG